MEYGLHANNKNKPNDDVLSERMVTTGKEKDEDCCLPVWLEGDSLAPPCSSDDDVCRAMIELCEIGPEDTLIDLGVGMW